MAQTSKQRTGRWGETVAAYYLESKGYRVLARNVRTPRGEIDLVVRPVVDSKEQPGIPAGIIFVEVKTRTTETFGLPEDAVDARKLEHLFLAAQAYLEDHPDFGGLEWRIDVVAIQGRPGANVNDMCIEHFENISA